MREEQFDSVRQTLEDNRLYFENYLASSKTDREEGVPEQLFEAMEYTLTAGGKRLRPVLCLAAAELCGCARGDALPMAMGLEMFHSASLIHDDLPCMDNDDLRRGKLSNHKKFGETMAVLAGDSLMIEAFAYPLRRTKNIAHKKILNAIGILGGAAGAAGVCGGQALDMGGGLETGAGQVRRIAALKTAALIQAAVLCGAALGTDDDNILKNYAIYGKHLGLAFQIIDDILDVTGDAARLGKNVGKDAVQEKITHVTVLGLDEARRMAEEETLAAREAIVPVASAGFLALLPLYLLQRID